MYTVDGELNDPGVLGLRDKIISVEEALQGCGLTTGLAKHSKERLDQLLKEGFTLGLQSGIEPASTG